VSGQLHAPALFTTDEKAPGTRCIGGWVGPRIGLDDIEKRLFLPHRNSNSDSSVLKPVASRYSSWSYLALKMEEICLWETSMSADKITVSQLNLNGISVASCRHIHEKCLFRSTSWNLYFAWQSITKMATPELDNPLCCVGARFGHTSDSRHKAVVG
jgi:hypothetical protein